MPFLFEQIDNAALVLFVSVFAPTFNCLIYVNTTKMRIRISLHLLAAINAVQSLLQLSKCVALEALCCFLWDRGQWLPEQRLGGLGRRLGELVLALGLRLYLLKQKSRRKS